MRNRFLGMTFALLVALSPIPAIFSQTAAPPKAKTQAAATPNLSGVWRRSRSAPDKTRKYTIYELAFTIGNDVPPMTPWAEAKYEANRPNLGPRAVSLGESNDPIMQCFPPGVPRVYLIRGEPIEIDQIQGRVLMIYEYDHFIRNIYTDGRSHPADPNPSWMGDSIGKWEGDELVVDTVGFNGKTWLDLAGHPTTDQLHVIERYSRPQFGELKLDITIEDPAMYTKPLKLTERMPLMVGEDLIEYVCAENERDVRHLVPGEK